MRKTLLLLLVSTFFMFSCQNSSDKEVHITGELNGGANQKVFLEKLSFNQNAPVVVDSSDVKDGAYDLKASISGEELFNIRFENNPNLLVISDKSNIKVSANAADSSLKSAASSSPATASLYHLMLAMDSVQTKLMLDDQTHQMYLNNGNDSMANKVFDSFNETHKWYGQYVTAYADSTQSPIVSLFALSYAMNADGNAVSSILAGIKKKWPDNQSVKEVVTQLEAMAEAQQNPQSMQQGLPVGTKAPDFTMDDVNGKSLSLSDLKGKFVLVDFWASWCQPCRVENPNVVRAYNQFKDKNFTILGVSLDQNKENWVEAIKADGLDWHQISDLKFWESAAVPLYNIQGIPYNVLVNPQGTIIASELRGPALEKKLEEVLN